MVDLGTLGGTTAYAADVSDDGSAMASDAIRSRRIAGVSPL
jgi:hypothetical protein